MSYQFVEEEEKKEDEESSQSDIDESEEKKSELSQSSKRSKNVQYSASIKSDKPASPSPDKSAAFTPNQEMKEGEKMSKRESPDKAIFFSPEFQAISN